MDATAAAAGAVSASPLDFCRRNLRLGVAQICLNLGWHSMHASAHDVLADVLERCISQLAVLTRDYANQFGRTEPSTLDVGLALNDAGISLSELEDYLKDVEPSPSRQKVARFPRSAASDLAIPDPLELELGKRPEHIPSHLPLMGIEVADDEAPPAFPSTPDDADLTVLSEGALETGRGEKRALSPSPDDASGSVVKRQRSNWACDDIPQGGCLPTSTRGGDDEDYDSHDSPLVTAEQQDPEFTRKRRLDKDRKRIRLLREAESSGGSDNSSDRTFGFAGPKVNRDEEDDDDDEEEEEDDEIQIVEVTPRIDDEFRSDDDDGVESLPSREEEAPPERSPSRPHSATGSDSAAAAPARYAGDSDDFDDVMNAVIKKGIQQSQKEERSRGIFDFDSDEEIAPMGSTPGRPPVSDQHRVDFSSRTPFSPPGAVPADSHNQHHHHHPHFSHHHQYPPHHLPFSADPDRRPVVAQTPEKRHDAPLPVTPSSTPQFPEKRKRGRPRLDEAEKERRRLLKEEMKERRKEQRKEAKKEKIIAKALSTSRLEGDEEEEEDRKRKPFMMPMEFEEDEEEIPLAKRLIPMESDDEDEPSWRRRPPPSDGPPPRVLPPPQPPNYSSMPLYPQGMAPLLGLPPALLAQPSFISPNVKMQPLPPGMNVPPVVGVGPFSPPPPTPSMPDALISPKERSRHSSTQQGASDADLVSPTPTSASGTGFRPASRSSLGDDESRDTPTPPAVMSSSPASIADSVAPPSGVFPLDREAPDDEDNATVDAAKEKRSNHKGKEKKKKKDKDKDVRRDKEERQKEKEAKKQRKKEGREKKEQEGGAVDGYGRDNSLFSTSLLSPSMPSSQAPPQQQQQASQLQPVVPKLTLKLGGISSSGNPIATSVVSGGAATSHEGLHSAPRPTTPTPQVREKLPEVPKLVIKTQKSAGKNAVSKVTTTTTTISTTKSTFLEESDLNAEVALETSQTEIRVSKSEKSATKSGKSGKTSVKASFSSVDPSPFKDAPSKAPKVAPDSDDESVVDVVPVTLKTPKLSTPKGRPPKNKGKFKISPTPKKKAGSNTPPTPTTPVLTQPPPPRRNHSPPPATPPPRRPSITIPATPVNKSSAKKKKKRSSEESPMIISETILEPDFIRTNPVTGVKIWICPACRLPDDGSPMIGCDGGCDAWYHFVCVGLSESHMPEDDAWYCRNCAPSNVCVQGGVRGRPLQPGKAGVESLPPRSKKSKGSPSKGGTRPGVRPGSASFTPKSSLRPPGPIGSAKRKKKR